MRNLALSDFKSQKLHKLENCQIFCQDRQWLYLYDKGLIIKTEGNNEEVVCDLTQNLYPVSRNELPEAIDISYSYVTDSIYLILSNGDIVSFSNGSESIVGTLEGGIKAAKWSPDQEVVALITGEDSVVVMLDSFDAVSVVQLHGGGFGEKQFITVGWGKKETQFRGSEGKFKAKDQPKEEAFECNEEINISWRGDAMYFAVSCINPETSQRYLRIFDKQGTLQYTSEILSGQEGSLDWRPSGNLITSTQKLPNKYNVCFFEKNGLKHGEFSLRSNHDKIRVDKVLWNGDSRILALLITKLSDNSKYIELYTVNNYHWYCKYTIKFETNIEPLAMKWDMQKNNILHVIVKENEQMHLNSYSWLWIVNKSKGNESFVAVIDGCSLLVTSFNRGITPPPMCTYKIETATPINSVSFAADDLILHLADNTVMLYKFNETDVRHELIKTIKVDEFSYNTHWVSPDTIMQCRMKVKENAEPFLLIIDIDSDSRKEISLESSIAILKASKTGVVMSLNNNEMCSYKDEILEPLMLSYTKQLLDFEVLDDNSIAALDISNKLYVNDKIVLDNVLSFHIHENFILVTTMKHELICLNLENDLNDELCKRRVERGARLVTSVHKDMKVILQMPRGNLECIQPRALSIFMLGKYLNNLNYYEAVDLMRKQRINLNLIYDHNPDLFCSNLHIFLDQIKDQQWISLFLSELSNEDVTKTMYSVLYKDAPNRNGVLKVDLVCDLVEKALMKKPNADEYLLPVLTCYIKRGNIEFLESTLLKLKTLKEKEARGIKSAVSFDEAFRYVLYLVDVEELYKIALGMYDFDLTMMVAAKSQKDPKEYIPFLNELKKLEPNYQKFMIDKYLKRYSKALTSLVLCDEENSFTECLNFIKAHQLYKLALKLIPQNTDRYKNVCICYAEELMRLNCYEEAGIMYSNAGMYKNAMEACRRSGNWQEVVSCCRELNLNENEASEVYLDLAMELCESKRFAESASIYLDHFKSVEDCVRTLCKGKLFAEAYRIAYLHNRVDLISSVIVPGVAEEGNLMKLQIQGFEQTYRRQKDRLQVVRQTKRNEKEEEFDGDDLYSEANTTITHSNASRTTNRTYRSAKNKRKHERKLLSLKEGSPYEDLALITSLHNVVSNCYNMKPEVRELNKFLLKINEPEKAEEIQKVFGELLKLIEATKSEIWIPELLKQQQYGPDATSNEIAAMYMRSEITAPVLLNPKFAIPPEPSNVKWELEILKPE